MRKNRDQSRETVAAAMDQCHSWIPDALEQVVRRQRNLRQQVLEVVESDPLRLAQGHPRICPCQRSLQPQDLRPVELREIQCCVKRVEGVWVRSQTGAAGHVFDELPEELARLPCSSMILHLLRVLPAEAFDERLAEAMVDDEGLA